MQILQKVFDVLPIISVLISAVFSVILFFRTGNKKYLKEVNDMIKYRSTSLNKVSTDGKNYSQNFEGTKYKPVYRLNKVTGELELTDEVIDITELINSAKEYCLNACLERFIPQNTDEESVVRESYDSTLTNLDELTYALELAEEYRDKFGMSIDASFEDIFKRVNDESVVLKSKLDSLKKKPEQQAGKPVEDNSNKEV